MIEISNVNVYDMAESIYASGYPMDVDLADKEIEIEELEMYLNGWDVPERTLNHFKRICKLGRSKDWSGHNQALTGILVSFDIKCSNKMWVELERYKFVNFVSSQSTMHRITEFDIKDQCNEYVWGDTIDRMNQEIGKYNYYMNKGDKNSLDLAKELRLQILYNVPSGFELTARLTTNYRALKNIYNQRHNHRLPEWRMFCEWILGLPFFAEICGFEPIYPKKDTEATDVLEFNANIIAKNEDGSVVSTMDLLKELSSMWYGQPEFQTGRYDDTEDK